MLSVVVTAMMSASVLPEGSAPDPVALPHFPDRLHALVWRNWQVIPVERLASVVGAEPADILRTGRAMGLSGPPPITQEQERRSYITVIRRNWHLLPYDQLLALLGWTEEELAYTLREDDFLFIKLGGLKPKCDPIRYEPPSASVLDRERAITQVIREEFPQGVGLTEDPLFGFVSRLAAPDHAEMPERRETTFSPRFCYSYFALYGDPLVDPALDPYPEGYLDRLARVGVDGVWIQGVLYKLAPFPWDARISEGYENRLAALRDLVARAGRRGIGVYLYLNEPRAMPVVFFERHPELRGVTEGDYAALCTSVPAVQGYLVAGVASICRAVPELAGFFTITASENLTNCWSHGNGAACPRCGQRPAAEVIAEVNRLVASGIREAGTPARLIAWDWGWTDEWAEEAIAALPEQAALMSVSEWSIPIERGGIRSVVGEYSISTVGPGPRAERHWVAARDRGLKTLAKIQAGNTWELAAVPYIPAVENVARHVANLREKQLDGLMLGWTLGGYPSPNLEVVAEVCYSEPGEPSQETVQKAMEAVAQKRFGPAFGPVVVRAWRRFSAGFSEFPFHGGVVYTAPLQMGPANLLWGEPTGYRATMVGFPYDDLESWRAVYPAHVFVTQLDEVADGFEEGLAVLKTALLSEPASMDSQEGRALREELSVAEAGAIHFRSAANQARFVLARGELLAATTPESAVSALNALEAAVKQEIDLARRLHAIQTCDSRIGFEASNQYFYVPLDLAEKVVNCRYLLDQWIPAQRKLSGVDLEDR